MPKPPSHIRRAFEPLSWFYGMGVWIHRKMFDIGILKAQKYAIPIICVGNVTVGGTGKTPHIEYLVQCLAARYRVAVVSRGYKRKSKGLRIVETTSHAHEVGDEPLQIKQKFPDTIVVVDKNRRNAIETLLQMDEASRPDVILMDDGMQHHYVVPSLQILLMDCNRPVYDDRLLPAGNLREPAKARYKAAIVVVTKCPEQMQPIDYRIISNRLDLYPYQSLFFTSFEYDDMMPVFPDTHNEAISLNDLRKKHVLLIVGIASPEPLVEKMERKTYNLHTMFFADHHAFGKADIDRIRKKVDEIDSGDKIIVTTEKDAVRLRCSPHVDDDLKQILYYIPISVNFASKSEKKVFNKKINNHVRNHQANIRLSQR